MNARRLLAHARPRSLRVLSCLLPTVLVLAACAVGCGSDVPDGNELAGHFDAARAWKLLAEQVDLGPRPSGSEAAEGTRKLIERELRASGLEPVREPFTADTPAGPIEMANVWAEIPAAKAPDQAPVIVLGSHYDTKREPFRFVGANDGGSSTAVLLELARVLAANPSPKITYRVVFFDGEEAVRSFWEDPDNRYGSLHHVEQLKKSGAIGRVRYFVLLDLVGDRDLHLEYDSNSDRKLVDAFFAAARRGGLGAHVKSDRDGMPIKDDHLSFLSAGVESVDLIDFDYGPDNAWWHSADDTLDKCSQESLDAIGRIVLLGLPQVEQMALARH